MNVWMPLYRRWNRMCGDCLVTRPVAAQMVLDARDTDESLTGLYHIAFENLLWSILEAADCVEVDPNLSVDEVDDILGSIGPFAEAK